MYPAVCISIILTCPLCSKHFLETVAAHTLQHPFTFESSSVSVPEIVPTRLWHGTFNCIDSSISIARASSSSEDTFQKGVIRGEQRTNYARAAVIRFVDKRNKTARDGTFGDACRRGIFRQRLHQTPPQAPRSQWILERLVAA